MNSKNLLLVLVFFTYGKINAQCTCPTNGVIDSIIIQHCFPIADARIYFTGTNFDAVKAVSTSNSYFMNYNTGQFEANKSDYLTVQPSLAGGYNFNLIFFNYACCYNQHDTVYSVTVPPDVLPCDIQLDTIYSTQSFGTGGSIIIKISSNLCYPLWTVNDSSGNLITNNYSTTYSAVLDSVIITGLSPGTYSYNINYAYNDSAYGYCPSFIVSATVPLSTSIKQNNNSLGNSVTEIIQNLTIFPNPLNSSATILFNSTIKNAELNMYNIDGQKIKTINHISGQEMKLYRDKLSNGIYFIRITQDNKVIALGELVITDN